MGAHSRAGERLMPALRFLVQFLALSLVLGVMFFFWVGIGS